jgi:hypothetical protein
MEAELRQLKIKTGTLKRLRKELGLYQAEADAEQAKVNKLRDAGADSHDVKYAVRGAGPADRGHVRGTKGCSARAAAALVAPSGERGGLQPHPCLRRC